MPNCRSGKSVPSHAFPKDEKRRKEWFKNLNMEPLITEDIKRLKVCYKHFYEKHYSGSTTRRVLLHCAVPCVNVQEEQLVNVTNPCNVTPALDIKDATCSIKTKKAEEHQEELLDKEKNVMSALETQHTILE